MSDAVLKKLEELKRAVEGGKVVRISGVRVRKLEIQQTRRGGVIVIINDGEIIDYATRLFARKIEVLEP